MTQRRTGSRGYNADAYRASVAKGGGRKENLLFAIKPNVRTQYA